MEWENRRELTSQKKIDILMGVGKYKQAATIAEELGRRIEIKDSRGTMYRIAPDGSVRRLVSKRRRRGR